MLVAELVELHRVAARDVGPELLRPPFAVVGDDRVGGREDRLGRAIVLLELDHLRFREVGLEVEDVADVGGPEAVDRLVLVADHHQVAVLLGEQLQHPVLGVVGVLVLVDEDVTEGAPPALADVLEELQHVDRADQQVVEVHRVGLEHPLLVEREDFGDDLLEAADHHFAVAGGVDQLVLGAGDLPLDGARRVAFRVDPELGQAAFDHPQRVALVVDREALGVAEPLGVDAQHPRAGGVEGGHPHRPHRAADQVADPLAHLGRRLVGEGDREDLPGAGLAGRQQVGDPVGEDAGLAGAGAGQDQQRPVGVLDRLALRRVEAREQPLDPVGAGLGRGAEEASPRRPRRTLGRPAGSPAEHSQGLGGGLAGAARARRSLRPV